MKILGLFSTTLFSVLFSLAVQADTTLLDCNNHLDRDVERIMITQNAYPGHLGPVAQKRAQSRVECSVWYATVAEFGEDLGSVPLASSGRRPMSVATAPK